VIGRPVVWLNLVCLDAPLVAIAWQWLFAREIHAGVSAADRVALFLSAWLIYLSDRLFDSMSWSAGNASTLRERFCSEHRHVWVRGLLIVALLDGLVLWRFVDRATFRHGIALATAVVSYVLINAVVGRVWKTLPVKEITIGCLFAAGTLLVLLPSLRSASRGFGGAALMFAGLCSLNCMSIAFWERHLDRSRGRHSIATRWPGIQPAVVGSLLVLAVASLALPLRDGNLRSLSMCLAASLGLLAALHLWRTDALDEQTALADLVLLTPCCVFILEKGS
jgi:hypothetical protein